MTVQKYRKFVTTLTQGADRNSLIVPVFQLPPQQWLGNNQLLLEFPINNTNYFSFFMPIQQFGANFVICVRYEIGGAVARFKFWNGDGMYAPLYTGQSLGPGAILEVWSVNSDGQPYNYASKDLPVSTLAFPLYYYPTVFFTPNTTHTVLQPSDPTLLVTYENPFADQVQGVDELPPPFDPGDAGDPGGGIPTLGQFLAVNPGAWLEFPSSGYGIASIGSAYPDNITAAQAAFWLTLLQKEWSASDMDDLFEERHPVWLYYGSAVELYDFVAKFNSGNSEPAAGPNNTTNFALPWVLSYVWKSV